MIRGYVFIKKLILELERREDGEVEKINWKKVVPKNSNLLNGMLNISLITMVLLDLPIKFFKELNKQKDDEGFVKALKKAMLKANYITLTRFTVSVARTVDTRFGIRKLRKQRFMIEDYLNNRPYFVNECNINEEEPYEEGIDWLYSNFQKI